MRTSPFDFPDEVTNQIRLLHLLEAALPAGSAASMALQPPALPYPISAETAWVQSATPQTSTHNPIAKLIDAVQRQDISREDIARTVVSCNPGLEGAARLFLDPSQARQSVHKFCAAVRACDPSALDRTVDILCTQQVSRESAAQAQQAMQLQRERQRMAANRYMAADECHAH